MITRIQKIGASFAAAMAVFVPAAVATAGTAESGMDVSAAVTNSCTIQAGPLAFGTYDTVSGNAVNGLATLTVACTQGAGATITLDAGENPAGVDPELPLRRMIGVGGAYLSYSLYSNAERSAIWGPTANTDVAYLAQTAGDEELTVYGRIEASQDVAADTFSDTVIATISF